MSGTTRREKEAGGRTRLAEDVLLWVDVAHDGVVVCEKIFSREDL